MTLQQFVTRYQGKAVDVDGVPQDTGQCVQLVARYCIDVLHAPIFYAPYAVDWWTEFSGSVLQSHFTKVSPTSIKAGDIVVWGASSLINSPVAGHIDIALSAVSNSSFTGFDSNWGGVRNAQGYPVAHDVHHSLVDVLGGLRLKPATAPVTHPTYYNVVSGDTVTSICAKFKITVVEFQKLNPTITNINIIYIGERVRVR